MESSESSDDGDLPGVKKLVPPPPAPLAPTAQRNAGTPKPIQNHEMQTQTSPRKNNDHCVVCMELKLTSIEFKMHLDQMKEIALDLKDGCETLRYGISSLPGNKIIPIF
jgi:hypothetical protein